MISELEIYFVFVERVKEYLEIVIEVNNKLGKKSFFVICIL